FKGVCMLSLRSLYQIGHGPSSSHTMGPARAIQIIKDEHPEITHFQVTLYNSLALTGKGHLTEDAMRQSVEPRTIEFSNKIDLEKFANTIVVLGYQNDQLISTDEVKS